MCTAELAHRHNVPVQFAVGFLHDLGQNAFQPHKILLIAEEKARLIGHTLQCHGDGIQNSTKPPS